MNPPAKRAKARMAPGVLARHQLESLFSGDVVHYAPENVDLPEIDGSAFDLTVGRRVWVLTESLRPTTRQFDKIRRAGKKLDLENDEYGEYFLFSAGQVYLVELEDLLDLPPNLSGRATGKSTIGRLDVITRLLTKDAREYDTVSGGYRGDLFLLVSPQTFSIKVKPGQSLNQLRLYCGPQHEATIDREMIGHYGQPFWYVTDPASPTRYGNWEGIEPDLSADPRLFDLTVDLADPRCQFIYEAREPTIIGQPPVIDLRSEVGRQIPEGRYDKEDFFVERPVVNDRADRFVVLEPRKFYIMKSRERLCIPRNVAVEVIAISERIGDIRIHYAGFAHPGFGTECADPTRMGTPLIFEVRATDMLTKLFDRSTLAKVQLFRMSEPYTGTVPSVYNEQELQLSKVFK